MPANDKLTELQNIKPMLGKFIAGDFIAIADEMCRFPASNEYTELLSQSNSHWMVLFQKCFRRFGPSTKIAPTAKLSLT
jgi:hypothetical protein